MKQWQLCDAAIREVINIDPDCIFIDRHVVASALNRARGGVGPLCTAEKASAILQAHRAAQRTGLTEYVTFSEDHARASVWCIVSGPGCTSMDRRREVTMGHSEYVITDTARRFISDIGAEINPAVLSHPAIQAFITHQMVTMENQMRAAVSSMHAAVDLLELLSGDTADRSRVRAV